MLEAGHVSKPDERAAVVYWNVILRSRESQILYGERRFDLSASMARPLLAQGSLRRKLRDHRTLRLVATSIARSINVPAEPVSLRLHASAMCAACTAVAPEHDVASLRTALFISCACTWWVQPPFVPVVAAIACLRTWCHVACFSLDHEGFLDCWITSGGEPA